MRLAAIINVGHGSVALQRAVSTQTMLLDRLSTKLNSIRLAAPRLLHQACTSAIAESPDMLVMVGGPRSARRAGELAHRHGIPILFLSGLEAGAWAHHLCGSLSLEDRIGALAQENLRPLRLGVGMAGDRVFFQQASCGLFPHLPELQRTLQESDTFAEGWRVLSRATDLARFLVLPNVHFDAGDSSPQQAPALIIDAAAHRPQEASASLRCSAIHYGALGIVGAVMRSCMGGDWRGGRIEQFESAALRVKAGKPSWILLDGDPVRFEDAVEFRFHPGAVQTFAFNAVHASTNDNHPSTASEPQSFNAASASQWNFGAGTSVAFSERRGSGYPIH